MERKDEKKEEPNFAKYLSLYLSRFQQSAHGASDPGSNLDIFRPFKFVWAVLTVLWQWIFGERR